MNLFERKVNYFKFVRSKNWQVYLSCFFVVSVICLTLRSIYFCQFGLEISDEGFYLNFIAHPELYSWSVTQFAFIYGLLFELVGSNVFALRVSTLLLTFALSALLMWRVLSLSSFFPAWESTFVKLNLAFSGACVSLLASLLFGGWLPTPSYNTLCLQGLLIVSIGALSIYESSYVNIYSWILVGLGAAVVFLAKPSSALALALWFLVYLCFFKKVRYLNVIIAIAVSASLLLLSGIIIDGSVQSFILRVSRGLTFVEESIGYNLSMASRIDKFPNFRFSVIFYLSCAAIAGFVVSFCCLRLRTLFSRFNVFVLLIGTLTIMALSFDFYWIRFDKSKFTGLVFILLPLFAASSYLIQVLLRGSKLFERIYFAKFLFLFGLPAVYVYGTGSNYWMAAGPAAIFWSASSCALAIHLPQLMRGPVIFIITGLSICFTISTLNSGFSSPYRQPSIHGSKSEIIINGSKLFLSSEFYNYYYSAQKTLYENGFEAGLGIIDLTGHSPGLIFATSAKSLGQAWMIGGYKGSNIIAAKSIALTNCNLLKNAWLLYEPKGPRKISRAVLTAFGANFDKDYAEVGRIRRPRSGGWCADGCEQVLLKPTRSEEIAHKSCLERRG